MVKFRKENKRVGALIRRKEMKKVIALVLCVMLAIALVGCSGGSSDGVVGTWKYVLSEEEKQELLALGEDLSQLIAVIEDEMLEIKSDGTWELKFSSTNEVLDQGEYTVEGNLLTLISEEGDENIFEINGDTLKEQGNESILQKQ